MNSLLLLNTRPDCKHHVNRNYKENVGKIPFNVPSKLDTLALFPGFPDKYAKVCLFLLLLFLEIKAPCKHRKNTLFLKNALLNR